MSIEIDYKIIGLRLKQFRKDLNFKQTEVAKYLGIDRSSLSKIETGEMRILAHHLFRASTILGRSMDDFLDRTQMQKEERSIDRFMRAKLKKQKRIKDLQNKIKKIKGTI